MAPLPQLGAVYAVLMKLRTGPATLTVIAALTLLTACSPTGGGGAAPTQSGQPTASVPVTSETPAPPSTPSNASPSATAKPVQLPTDCREILSKQVLSQLEGVPLNDPGFGEAGVQPDGSLVCNWADPRADTTRLTTSIERKPRGEALDALNALMDGEGFTCYESDGGTRCEKIWQNEQYPVTDGRTLFWRDGVMIDTRYSNLAPEGYTASIVKSIWG